MLARKISEAANTARLKMRSAEAAGMEARRSRDSANEQVEHAKMEAKSIVERARIEAAGLLKEGRKRAEEAQKESMRQTKEVIVSLRRDADAAIKTLLEEASSTKADAEVKAQKLLDQMQRDCEKERTEALANTISKFQKFEPLLLKCWQGPNEQGRL